MAYCLRYYQNEALPKLAWLAEIDKEKNISVYCGKKVECNEDFFIAGVWSGEFKEAGFLNTEYLLGSGAKIIDDEVIFTSATHALEKIYLARDGKRIVVSNSLPFVTAFLDLEMDQTIDQYEAILCSILDGVEKYQKEIPLKDGRRVEQYFVSEIHIDEKMNIKVERKAKVKEFENFEDFYNRLMTSMTLIRDNAVSSDRKNSAFGLVSTISSGYDSSTCATVARKLGCETVVTLTGGKYDNDSGEDTASQLGYGEVIKRTQQSYKTKEGCIDAEYVCNGELGTHLQFSVFEDLFKDNLVFMGLRGDYYWGKATFANDNFEMKHFFYYETNIGYIENALKNGYVVVPLPTFGSSVATSVRKITLSDEMKDWSLGTAYDRPIPRRIVESAGVSRESFGMKKTGGGFTFSYETVGSLKNKLTEEGYRSFLDFYNNTKKERKSLKRVVDQIKFTKELFPTYFNVACRKTKLPFRLEQKALRMANPGVPSDLIFWGMKEMKERYKAGLQK